MPRPDAGWRRRASVLRFPRSHEAIKVLLIVSACAVLALCVAAVTLEGRASAGTLGVRDDAHALSSEDAAKLRAVVASQPFDGRVAFTTAYVEPQELARYAKSVLSAPNMVVVAIDPQHRHVRVEYGDGSHIPRSAWPGIDRAGNGAIRARCVGGGRFGHLHRGGASRGRFCIARACRGAASGKATRDLRTGASPLARGRRHRHRPLLRAAEEAPKVHTTPAAGMGPATGRWGVRANTVVGTVRLRAAGWAPWEAA